MTAVISRPLKQSDHLTPTTNANVKFEIYDPVEYYYEKTKTWSKGFIINIINPLIYNIQLLNSNNNDGEIFNGITSKKLNAIVYKTNEKFNINDKVDANYKQKGKYYPGVVKSINEEVTYSVTYSDGDKEANVPLKRLRNIPVYTSKKAYTTGNKIEANHSGKGIYHKGVIMNVNENIITYSIAYDDGEKEEVVLSSNIRNLTTYSIKEEYSINDEIECEFQRKSKKFFAGKIIEVSTEPTYSIRFESGVVEEVVITKCIRKCVMRINKDLYQLNDTIEAKFGGGERYFGGKIAGIENDGLTYYIIYDDGDKEHNVKVDYIRMIQVEVETPTYSLNDKVEALASNSTIFASGEIIKINNYKTYSIKYADGDFQEGVDFERIRVPIYTTAEVYSINDKVEAAYKGKENYFRGTITSINNDPTYEIDYEDRIAELNVPASFIRNVTKYSKKEAYQINDEVEGIYN